VEEVEKPPHHIVREEIQVRRALLEDAPHIAKLIDASIRKLAAGYYDPAQIESSLKHLFGVDSTMIMDQTYFVAEVRKAVPAPKKPPQGLPQNTPPLIVAAGGWSFRRTPFGGDQEQTVRDADTRDPRIDPAVIRAMYVHPDWARKKLGHLIITACEHAARAAGFSSYELVATLSGVSFYEKQGYSKKETIEHRLPDGTLLDFIRMAKMP